MSEVEYITLENNQEYIILDMIKKYAYLKNEKNEDDFCIRKIISEGDKQYFVKLDNDQEFQDALNLFYKKYINE